MSLAVIIPYRPDSPQRERIFAYTSRAWAQLGAEVIHANDGLTGLFSYARAANRGRAMTDADCLITYCVDALPLPVEALEQVAKTLDAGTPWIALFDGQQRFTPDQTERLLCGTPPVHVGHPQGQHCPGREALLGIRADVWDDIRGMDERFVGWGPEDFAFHRVLSLLYPDGCDIPTNGLFQSLWHPDTPRTAWPANDALWQEYRRIGDAAALRSWYLAR